MLYKFEAQNLHFQIHTKILKIKMTQNVENLATLISNFLLQYCPTKVA